MCALSIFSTLPTAQLGHLAVLGVDEVYVIGSRLRRENTIDVKNNEINVILRGERN